ncbi:MAG TPA: hypothetical protein VEU73_15790 [Gemmatimonadales bacterium]|nr:hypothetical protein [Gemmatimonadales bacterium]
MLIDGYMPHYDVVERHRVVVGASREGACRGIREMDFMRALIPAARAIDDMRDVPRAIREWVHRIEHLPPDTRFTLSDALGGKLVLLGERRGRAVAIGAVGKLWKQHVAFLTLTAPEFHAFREPKYAKLAIAFWAESVGRDKSAVRFEARALATDDSARAHLRRWYRDIKPYTSFFMRRALANIKAEAEALVATSVA